MNNFGFKSFSRTDESKNQTQDRRFWFICSSLGDKLTTIALLEFLQQQATAFINSN